MSFLNCDRKLMQSSVSFIRTHLTLTLHMPAGAQVADLMHSISECLKDRGQHREHSLSPHHGKNSLLDLQ